MIRENNKELKGWRKCERCFWNYNCAYYGEMNEDEWTEEAIEDWKNCKRYLE